MRSHSSWALALILCLTVGCDASDPVSGIPIATPHSTFGIVPTVVECGASIVTDFKLGNDLVCTGDALFVNADGISIDLNGHSIIGEGTGVGITLRTRHDVLIHGGTVRGFVTGMFISQSSNVTIKQNSLTQNREAIFLIGSSDNVIKENHAWQNQLRGIMLRPTNSGIPSTRNLVAENTLTDNPSGILVFAQSGNRLRENWIQGSSFAALDLNGPASEPGGSGNLIKENRLESSAAGIRFGAGWTGNSFVENLLANNACGLFGAGAGNTFTENSFVGNGSDVC